MSYYVFSDRQDCLTMASIFLGRTLSNVGASPTNDSQLSCASVAPGNAGDVGDQPLEDCHLDSAIRPTNQVLYVQLGK